VDKDVGEKLWMIELTRGLFSLVSSFITTNEAANQSLLHFSLSPSLCIIPLKHAQFLGDYFKDDLVASWSFSVLIAVALNNPSHSHLTSSCSSTHSSFTRWYGVMS